jgi:two-component system cell cycle sensor histidine kinase/response regulator CckA
MKNSAPAPNTLRQFIWMLALIIAAGLVVRLTGGLLGFDYSLGLLALLDAFSLGLLVAPLLWWCLRRQEQRRNQAEVELRHSELKFRRLFEGSADAMLLLDPDSGRFIDCNQAAAEMLDYSSREEVLRHRPAELSPPLQPDGQASATKAPAMIAHAVAAGSHRFEWIHCSDRRPGFPVEVLLTPIQLEGQQLLMTTWRDISARKQAESHHHLLSSALRSAANAFVITDRWGTIEWVNPAFTALTGYTLAEALGRNPGDLLRSGEHDAVFFKNLWDTILAGQTWQGETINRRKDGTLYTEFQTITPVRAGQDGISHFVAIKEDVTARKQTEARLREQAEVIDKSPVAIIITDLAHRVTYCNEGACRLYSLSAAQMLGHTADELFTSETMRALGPARETALTTGAWRGEVPIAVRDGRRLTVEFIMSLIRGGEHQPSRRLSIAIDITEKARLEEQLHRVQRLDTLGMLAAGIAHDLNNILSPVLMAGPLLRNRATHPSDLRVLDLVEKSAERGSALVRQILAFTRGANAERILLQARHVLLDVHQMVADTFPKSILVESVIPGDLWPVVSNATQLHQVVLNLCVNARDAMPGGGTLTLRAGNETLPEAPNGLPSGSYLIIEVADTGTGISPEVMAHIWDPFFTTKAAGHGTGLGLATVRGILAQHGGTITLTTTLGVGSVFRVFLPATTSAPATTIAAETTETEGDSLRNELVLIVDDDTEVRKLMALSLTQWGYRVLQAKDGTEATASYLAHSADISLIIFDLDLPGQDGITLARQLQGLRPDLRVLFVTGVDSMKNFLLPPLPAGAPLLKKPFARQALRAETERALSTPPFAL